MSYTIMRTKGAHAWRLSGAGEVASQWIYSICKRAGVEPLSLLPGVWHTITIP